MRKSRAMQRIEYDAIFAVAKESDGWIEVTPVTHLSRAEFVDDLRTAAEARGLNIQAMWSKKGWIMIRIVT